MDFKSDPNCRAEALDIIKSLKVNGSFDQFRKECFSEILAQSSYQTLKKNVEDYVHKYLNDIKPNANTKKQILRDNIRRNLTESHFMNDGINRIIEELVEPKLEKTFIDKIDDLVNKETKTTTESSLPSSASQQTISLNASASSSSQPQSQQQQQLTQHSQQPHQDQVKSVKKVISIEDFIPTPTESKSSPAHNISNKLERKPSTPVTPKQAAASLPPKPIVKEKPSKPVESHSKPAQVKKELPRLKSSEANAEKPTSSLKHSLSNLDDDDTDLEADSTNEYNFNWKLKNTNLDLDDLSVSSINTTDLSDFDITE